MNVLRVLWFLAIASIKNRVRSQLQRLRQPKYLIATLIGIAYLWFFFGRRLYGSRFEPVPESMRPIFVAGATVLAFGIILAGWIFGRDRAALVFTEAEIQLLFPGPVSRRALLLYKMSRSLLLLTLTSMITSLVIGVQLSGHFVFFAVGAWLALSTMSLHETATSLTREALRLRGRRGTAWLVSGIAVVCAVVGGVAWSSLRDLPPITGDQVLVQLADRVERAFASPLGILLFPIRAPVEVAFAANAAAFFRALPAAILLLAVHILWVLRSDVAFEEASVEEAERRAKLRDARRTRGSSEGVRPRSSLRLEVRGRPEWALAWKGRVALRRIFGSQLLASFVPLGLAFAMVGVTIARSAGLGWFGGAALGCAIAAAATTVLGPNVTRADFRLEQPHIDILRTWPLSGAQIVTGTLLGPLWMLALIQWALLALAVLLSVPVESSVLPLPLRIAVAASAALIGPLLTLANLLVQNAAVLLFPTWVPTGPEQVRGIEAMGARLLTFFGSMLVWLVAIVPAGLLGAVALGIVWLTIGPVGAPLAALVVAGVLALEAWAAIRLLGRVFERYDLTRE